MKDERPETGGLTRREFHRLGSAALAAAFVPVAARTASAAHHELVTEIAANEPLLAQLQYVNQSEKEGQQCASCVLYTPGEGGRGKCMILPEGLVKETGWCLSWAAKP